MLVVLIFLHPKKMYLFALFNLIFLLCLMYTKTYSEYMYAVFVHQTNISYEVPNAKHAFIL